MLTILTALRSSIIRYSLIIVLGIVSGIVVARNYYQPKLKNMTRITKLMQQQLTEITATNNSCQLQYSKLQEQVTKLKMDYNKKIRYYLWKIRKYQTNPLANLHINSNAPECQQLKMMLEQWRKYEVKKCTAHH